MNHQANLAEDHLFNSGTLICQFPESLLAFVISADPLTLIERIERMFLLSLTQEYICCHTGNIFPISLL